MAITFNQFSGPTSQAAAGTNTFTVTSSIGNLLVLPIVYDAGSLVISSITDNKGNTWTLSSVLGSYFGSGVAYFAYSLGASAGVTSITVISVGTGGISVGLHDYSSLTGGVLYYSSNFVGNSSNPFVAGIPVQSGVLISILASIHSASAITGTLEPLDSSALVNKAASSYALIPSIGLFLVHYTASAGYWDMVVAGFTEQSPAATPTFSPGAGYYGASQTVSISSPTPSAIITYTLDGSTPVPGSNGFIYTGPITIATSLVINAVATAPGYTSSVIGTATYIITSSSLTNATPNLQLALLISGQNQPEITVNNGLIGLDEAMNSTNSFPVSNLGLTLTLAEFASTFLFVFEGALTQAITITVPATPRFFAVLNLTSGGYPITVIGLQGGSPLFPGVQVTQANGAVLLYCTGSSGQILSLSSSGGGGGGGLLPIPTTISLTSHIPAGGNNFQVAHGLALTPVAATIQMTSGGSIYFQSPTLYDSTYVYLVASDGSVTGDILLWV